MAVGRVTLRLDSYRDPPDYDMNSFPKSFLVAGRCLDPTNDIDFPDRFTHHRHFEPSSAMEH